MVRDYVEKLYLPAAQAFRERTAEGEGLARQLRQWEVLVRRQWHFMHWGKKEFRAEGNDLVVMVQLYLGELPPELVQVQLYAEPVGDGEAVRMPMERGAAIAGALNGFLYGCRVAGDRPPRDYTPRVIPYHPKARVPAELNLISWWPGAS